jgi:hypothetical protein
MAILRHPIRHWKVLVVLAAVVTLWAAGIFDHVLVNVGLNAKECGRNLFGTTYCGQELTDYNEHLAEVQRKLKTEAASARRESEAALGKLKHEGEEATFRAQQEAKRQSEAYGGVPPEEP